MPTTLLAVDDSVTMRKVLELTFAGEDFRVLTAEGADAALAKIRAERPAIVLCDVTLDGAGGYGLCTRIKAENPTIAVVMLASKQQPYDAGKGQAAKADDFVEKPFDTQQLIDKVKRLASKPADVPARAPAPEVPARPAGYAPGAPPAPSFAVSGARPSGATAPMGSGRPPVPGASGVNPRPSAPGMGASGGIGRGTLAYGGAGFPGPPPPPPPTAPAAAGLTLPGNSPSARGPMPSSPFPQSPAQPPAPAPRPSTPSAAQAVPAPPVAPSTSAAAGPPPAPVVRPPAPVLAPAPAIELAATASNSPLASKLATLGLTDAQVSAVLALSREVVERVVWEVVPVLAETMIKEEIARLTHNV